MQWRRFFSEVSTSFTSQNAFCRFDSRVGISPIGIRARVAGGIGDQPNYAYIVSTFPKAQHLSIALFADNNADALDVEPGASDPSDIPGWYSRQVARGIQRPVIYASASTMNSAILPVLSQAGIARSALASCAFTNS